MDLSQIRAFLAVAETGSFTKAAKLLHLSQPSISLKVKALEKHLNTSLIQRNQNKLRLTEQGEFTRSKLANILKEIDLLESHFKDIEDQKTNSITIYHESDFYLYAITQLLGQVESLIKGVKSVKTLQCESEQDVIENVAKQKYSLGLTKQHIQADGVSSFLLNNAEFMLLRKNHISDLQLSVDLSSLLSTKIWLPELESESLQLLKRRIKPLGLDIADFQYRSHVSESIMPQLIENSDDIGIRLCSQTEKLICQKVRINELSTPYGIFLLANKSVDSDFEALLTQLLVNQNSSRRELPIPMLKRSEQNSNLMPDEKTSKEYADSQSHINIGIQIRTIQTVVSGRAVQKLGLFETFLNDVNGSLSNKSHTVKWNDYKSAAPILSAIKAGKLDIAIIGDYAISHMANNVFNGEDQDVILVSFVSINPYGSGSNLFVRKDTGLKELQNFKNQSIAVPFLSTAHGSLLYNLNKRKILNTTRLININLENQDNKLGQTSEAKGMACFTPFDHFLEADHHYQKITDEVSTPFSFYGVVVRKEFATQNPYAIVSFLKAMLCSNYWFKSTTSSLQHLSRWTGVSESFVNSILGERNGNDCHYIPDMTIRQDWVKEYTEKIYIGKKSKRNEKSHPFIPEIETEFLDKAMKELGMFI
ncbi:MAG: hypothetical protein CL862_08395 [Cyanobium sp. NAT70]|nr:hypothetical protein [Cyanobium sp. NAT70]|tara:strand:- start:19439 stop:21382 length:1944 start_codon:yes stop_codon:yes gene_type:complete